MLRYFPTGLSALADLHSGRPKPQYVTDTYHIFCHATGGNVFAKGAWNRLSRDGTLGDPERIVICRVVVDRFFCSTVIVQICLGVVHKTMGFDTTLAVGKPLAYRGRRSTFPAVFDPPHKKCVDSYGKGRDAHRNFRS